jgi:hypothetical protein
MASAAENVGVPLCVPSVLGGSLSTLLIDSGDVDISQQLCLL